MAKNIAIAYSMKKKKEKKGMRGAEQAIHLDEKRGYGNQKESGVHAASYSLGTDRGASQAGMMVRDAPYYKGKEKLEQAKEHHKEKLAELKEDKTDRKNLAEGGAVGCPNCGYSEGGAVANDTDMSACEMPNEFDELVLSGGLEADSVVKRAMKKKYK